MRTKTCILFMFIIIFIGACMPPRYHSDKNSIKQVTCFRRDALGDYYWELHPKEKMEEALGRVNGIFLKGMYPFLFKDHFDKEHPLKCAEADEKDDTYKEDDKGIRAFVSLANQPCLKVQVQKQPNSQQTTEPWGGMKSDIDGTDNPLIHKTRLVISSYLYSLNPADRLEKIYTLVTPLHGGVEFEDVVGIDRKKVDFGKLTDTYEIGTSPGIPIKMLTDNIVNLTPSFKREIARDLAKFYAIKNVEIFPLRNVLIISQDGGPARAEIRGNIEVKATVSIPPDLCKNVTIYEIESESKPTKPVLKPEHICYIDKVQALVASILVVRQVTQGEKTIAEDDDTIKHIAFRKVIVTDLWRNRDYLYGVKFVSGKSEFPIVFKNKRVESIVCGSLLLFNDLKNAIKFRDWISRTDGSIDVTIENSTVGVGIAEKIFPERGEFQVCTFGTSAPDLSKWSISKRYDSCCREWSDKKEP